MEEMKHKSNEKEDSANNGYRENEQKGDRCRDGGDLNVRDRKRLRGDNDHKQECEKETARKTWILEGESDDKESARVENVQDDMDEDEINPLNAYINSMVMPHVKIFPNKDSNSVEKVDEFMERGKKTEVVRVEFRKNLYYEVEEIQRMTIEEVDVYRITMELEVHGNNVPKPIKTWYQCGLSTNILETLNNMNFYKPMPIQAQAIPVIMSGRDCICVSRTGSGKTMAFVLPMLRHIMAQPKLESGDGPIGLIIAPTREHVEQIYSDIQMFPKVLGIRCVTIYEGCSLFAQQITKLKEGAEIVVCTPRMIHVLFMSGGKISNLKRVSYLDMDDVDCMIHMGFENQIIKLIRRTQPKRQTVLFSTAFPHQVKEFAQKVLKNPVKIQVGGRGVLNEDIRQLAEVTTDENERFLRLLEQLGEWYKRGKILIFVQSEMNCDVLFRDLPKHGYPYLILLNEDSDRESTLSDFKSSISNILIAISDIARDLDVKDILVINYEVPCNYVDYARCVNQTGRKGCAITILSSKDERFASNVLNCLKMSNQVVPNDLKAMADSFMAKKNQLLTENSQDNVVKNQKQSWRKPYGTELEINDLSQNARRKITRKETLSQITKRTKAAITTRGQYVEPGRIPLLGKRKLYLSIEGVTEESVKMAKTEL